MSKEKYVSVIKLTSTGQICIPKPLRDKLDLQDDDIFFISEKDNTIFLKKVDPDRIHKEFF